MFSAPGLGLKSRSIVIRNVRPKLEEGRFPVKREVGDVLEVSASIFREGHDKLTAVLLYRRKAEKTWRETPMTLINQGLDYWTGSVELTENAIYVYTIEAWTDVYASWCGEMEKKLEAGQNVALELREGRELIEETSRRATGEDAKSLGDVLKRFDELDDVGRAGLLMDANVRATESRWPDRGTAVRCDQELEVMVDRVEARYAAWYEMFPRSQGKVPRKERDIRRLYRQISRRSRHGLQRRLFRAHSPDRARPPQGPQQHP